MSMGMLVRGHWHELSVVALGMVALVGCDTPACPDGAASVDGRCVVLDASSRDAGASRDAGPARDGAIASDGGSSTDSARPDSASSLCPEACTGDTPLCDPGTGRCVACVSNGDCGIGACLDGMCVGCVADSDCFAPHPTCDVSTHTCVGCDSTGCPSDYEPACSMDTGSCHDCLAAGAECTELERLRQLRALNCELFSVNSYIETCVWHTDPFWQALEAEAARGTIHIELAACAMADIPRFPTGEFYINENRVLFYGTDTSCVDAITGTLPVGATCTNSFACASRFCRRDAGWDPTACGVCAERGTVGTPCGDRYNNWRCQDGLICNNRTHNCETQPVRGGACSQDYDCARGSSCLAAACLPTSEIARGTRCYRSDDCGSTLYCSEAGTCQDRLPVGATCSFWEDCVEGSFCVAGRCQRTIPIGGACSSVPCEAGATCSAGVCVRYPSAGEACIDRYTCGPGLFCGSTGTCLVRVDSGDSCVESIQCPFLQGCRHGICSYLEPIGGACTDDTDCRSSLRCVDSVCVALPTLGEACVDECLVGVCTESVCRTPAAGSVCVVTENTVDACGDTGECFYEEATSRRICGPSAEEGEPCSEYASTLADRACEHGLTCRSGRCVAPCML